MDKNLVKIILMVLALTITACTTTPEQSADNEMSFEDKTELAKNIEVATSYQQKGYHKVAVDYLSAVIKKYPTNPKLRMMIAQSYLQQKDYEKTKQNLLIALSGEAIKHDVYADMGQMYLLQSRPLEAEIVLNKSLQLKVNYKAYYRMGVALDMQRNHLQAQQYYRKAIAMNPNGREAINNLALSLAFQGQIDAAIELLEDSIIKHPDPKMYNNLSLLYWKKGDLKKAQSYMIFLSPEQVQRNLKKMRETMPKVAK